MKPAFRPKESEESQVAQVETPKYDVKQLQQQIRDTRTELNSTPQPTTDGERAARRSLRNHINEAGKRASFPPRLQEAEKELRQAIEGLDVYSNNMKDKEVIESAGEHLSAEDRQALRQGLEDSFEAIASNNPQYAEEKGRETLKNSISAVENQIETTRAEEQREVRRSQRPQVGQQTQETEQTRTTETRRTQRPQETQTRTQAEGEQAEQEQAETPAQPTRTRQARRRRAPDRIARGVEGAAEVAEAVRPGSGERVIEGARRTMRTTARALRGTARTIGRVTDTTAHMAGRVRAQVDEMRRVRRVLRNRLRTRLQRRIRRPRVMRGGSA